MSGEGFFSLPDLATLDVFAQAWVSPLKKGDVLALHGPVGAGKTTFARALLGALGIVGERPSPTFTLVQTYEASRFVVHHFDLYRLKRPEELEELGWEEACANGVVLVEWPEHAGSFLPAIRWDLHFEGTDGASRACRVLRQG